MDPRRLGPGLSVAIAREGSEESGEWTVAAAATCASKEAAAGLTTSVEHVAGSRRAPGALAEGCARQIVRSISGRCGLMLDGVSFQLLDERGCVSDVAYGGTGGTQRAPALARARGVSEPLV